MGKNKGGGKGKRTVGLYQVGAGLAAGAGILGAAWGAWQNYKDARAASFNPGAAVAYGLTGYRSKSQGGMDWKATGNVAVPLAAGGVAAVGASVIGSAVPQNVKAHEIRVGKIRIGA